MHEYGLCEGVLETVRQRADGRQVAGIRVRFGVRHAVVEESLAQAFSFVAAGTEAAGAVVELVTVPATIDCREQAMERRHVPRAKRRVTGPHQLYVFVSAHVSSSHRGTPGPGGRGRGRRHHGPVLAVYRGRPS